MQRFAELAPGVLVATPDYATTTSTVVTAGDGGCLVIDPAVSVGDLAALAADLAGAGLWPQAGFAAHPALGSRAGEPRSAGAGQHCTSLARSSSQRSRRTTSRAPPPPANTTGIRRAPL
jgi:hypothetical protein